MMAKNTLTTLTYASIASPSVTIQDVIAVVTTSIQNNSQNNITGMLCYGNKRFIQCIEGNRDLINELYTKLIKDTRHSQLILLEYKTIEARIFSSWSMGFVGIYDEPAQEIIREYTQMSEFKPELLTEMQAAKLIYKLKSFLEPQAIAMINK